MNRLQEDALDLAFNADFFATYEQELQNVSVKTMAQDVLAGILTLQDDDGQSRSKEQIRAETERFFANPIIARDMRLLDGLAYQYAQFCNHNHGLAEILNNGPLADVYEWGNSYHDNHVHDHDSADEHEGSNDRKKSKKKRHGNWLGWFVKIDRKATKND